VLPPVHRATTGPTGYMVVGPASAGGAAIDFAGGGTFWTTIATPGTMYYQSANMNYTVATAPTPPPSQTPPASGATPSQTYGIYLQRLACPGLPWQNTPTLPNYNPYLTVDYIPTLQPNFAFTNVAGAPAPAAMNQPLASRP